MPKLSGTDLGGINELYVMMNNVFKSAIHEWRCPSELSVLATLKSDDRAALKNAIRRVHEFSSFFSACRHDVHGVTQLFVRILQA